MTGEIDLDRFLRTHPREVGCDEALRILHVYVELVLEDGTGREAAGRYPAITAHFRACGPCRDDFEGLLLAVGGSLPPDRNKKSSK
jgi:hypothetical protein